MTEFHVMKSLAASIILGIPCDHLAGISDDELQKRIEVLSYGFGARTHLVLSQHFGELRKALGREEWNRIGRHFSEMRAPSAEQLGLLPGIFFEYAHDTTTQEPIRRILEIEYGRFECAHAEFDFANSIMKLEDLATHDLQLQPCIRLIDHEANRLVVSRNRENVFITSVDKVTFDVLTFLRNSSAKIEKIAEKLQTDKELAAFLVAAIRNSWLKQLPTQETT